MDVERDLISFVQHLSYDVCQYFLANKLKTEVNNGYLNPRCLLYSQFGQRTITRYLLDHLDGLYSKLENNPTLQNMDNNIFETAIANIIDESKWIIQGHASFYEVCVRVKLLEIFAMGHKFFDPIVQGRRIEIAIFEIAEKADTLSFLESVYDVARKNAHGILCTLFKILGININFYTTLVDKEMGCEEIEFSNDLLVFIHKTLPEHLKMYESDERFRTMDCDKFDILVALLLDQFEARSFPLSSDYNVNFLMMAVSIGFISLYSIRVSFNAGVQKGIDCITELVTGEKKYLFISRVTSEFYANLTQL